MFVTELNDGLERWVVRSESKSLLLEHMNGERRRHEYGVFQARRLLPMTPPPGTESTEDRAPVGEIVGV